MVNKHKRCHSLKLVFKIYCSKCGEKLRDDAKFCDKCGTPVKLGTKAEAVVKQFEMDPNLQDYWIRRLVAYIIDSILVAVAAGILLFIIRLPFYIANPFGLIDPFIFPFTLGLLLVPYSILTEMYRGATFGKGLMGLEVVTKSGENPSFEQALIRNISKIYGLLLILDFFGGLIISQGVNQKYSDRIADTNVFLAEHVVTWKR
jgi:uncharacterized RDD family membrane protein YckC